MQTAALRALMFRGDACLDSELNHARLTSRSTRRRHIRRHILVSRTSYNRQATSLLSAEEISARRKFMVYTSAFLVVFFRA
jgi:hypothetical protein